MALPEHIRFVIAFLRACGEGSAFATGRISNRAVFVVERHRGWRASHVHFDMACKHAGQDLGRNPALEAVADGADPAVGRIHRAERPLGPGRAFVGHGCIGGFRPNAQI